MLDLRTLKPLDTEAILSSARRTSKALVVHSANQRAGVGAEVAALIAQHGVPNGSMHRSLRLAGLDTPVPLGPCSKTLIVRTRRRSMKRRRRSRPH